MQINYHHYFDDLLESSVYTVGFILVRQTKFIRYCIVKVRPNTFWKSTLKWETKVLNLCFVFLRYTLTCLKDKGASFRGGHCLG